MGLPKELEYGKIPPQALEIEETIIGSLLLEPKRIHAVDNILVAESFYKDEHQKIYQCIIDLYRKGKTIDMLIVTDKLRNNGLLEGIGGAFILVQMTEKITSTGRLEHHARIVAQKYVQRELIRVSNEISSKAFDDSIDIEETLSFANQSLNLVNEGIASDGGFKHIKDVGEESFDGFLNRIKLAKEGKVTGIPTGLNQLDKLTLGWQKPWLYTLAARPSIGKTALLLVFAKTAAIHGFPVCIYSLEMANTSLYDRLIISESGVEHHEYTSGVISSDETINKIKEAKETLAKLPIYIDDKSKATFRHMNNHVRVMKNKDRCKLVLIDFLQLADYEGEKKGQEAETSEMAKSAQSLGKKHGVPVILLSQLNRECERRNDKKPELHDLRYSGAIEEASDVVILVHRPNKYGIEFMPDNTLAKNKMQLIVAKNRHGATGLVTCWHSDDLTKIKDYDRGLEVLDTNSDQFIESSRDEDDLPF
jgi:replicative DNA helicase